MLRVYNVIKQTNKKPNKQKNKQTKNNKGVTCCFLFCVFVFVFVFLFNYVLSNMDSGHMNSENTETDEDGTGGVVEGLGGVGFSCASLIFW